MREDILVLVDIPFISYFEPEVIVCKSCEPVVGSISAVYCTTSHVLRLASNMDKFLTGV